MREENRTVRDVIAEPRGLGVTIPGPPPSPAHPVERRFYTLCVAIATAPRLLRGRRGWGRQPLRPSTTVNGSPSRSVLTLMTAADAVAVADALYEVIEGIRRAYPDEFYDHFQMSGEERPRSARRPPAPR